MTKKLETIDISSSAQQASKKMRDKNVSSLVVTDNYNKPAGIVTERVPKERELTIQSLHED